MKKSVDKNKEKRYVIVYEHTEVLFGGEVYTLEEAVEEAVESRESDLIIYELVPAFKLKIITEEINNG